MSINTSNIFDSAAEAYDNTFTHSVIGKAQRKRVYHWLNKVDFFNEKNKIFEINCGTGFDAEQIHNKGLQIVATDGSGKMIEVAKEARSTEIDFFKLQFSEVAKDEKFKQSTILFSNFGGLNCLSKTELKGFTKDIAEVQTKGDLIAWVIMPDQCMMESFYFLLKFKFKKVFRRKQNESLKVNVDGVDVETYYHSPYDLKEVLGDKYRVELTKPVALFLPPSYLEPFFKKNKFLLKVLELLEKMFGWISFYSNFGDHYIIIARRL